MRKPPTSPQNLPREVREALVSLLAQMLVEEVQADQAVRGPMVQESPLRNHHSRLEKG